MNDYSYRAQLSCPWLLYGWEDSQQECPHKRMLHLGIAAPKEHMGQILRNSHKGADAEAKAINPEPGTRNSSDLHSPTLPCIRLYVHP